MDRKCFDFFFLFDWTFTHRLLFLSLLLLSSSSFSFAKTARANRTNQAQLGESLKHKAIGNWFEIGRSQTPQNGIVWKPKTPLRQKEIKTRRLIILRTSYEVVVKNCIFFCVFASSEWTRQKRESTEKKNWQHKVQFERRFEWVARGESQSEARVMGAACE